MFSTSGFNNKEYLLSIESSTIKLGLERTVKLMNFCGNPQQGLPVIQVAGTNGKGSTSAMIAKILECAGYKVGLSTSPHLVNVNERIRVNGNPINDEMLGLFIEKYKLGIEMFSASFFETITAMAFWFFKEKKVDIAVMETGLGGRLDSVTICNPILTVITPISLDHTEILGDSIKKIAHEKAGIMKKGVPCVISKQENQAYSVLNKYASKLNCDLIISTKTYNQIKPALMGKYQYENACLAISAVKNLTNYNISDKFIKDGVKKTVWYGRNQILQKSPYVIFDVAHNISGINSFLDFFKSLKSKGVSVLVLSLQKRKKIKQIKQKLIKTFNFIICCETQNPRTMTLESLSLQMGINSKIKYVKAEREAIKAGLKLLKNKNDKMAIIGTHYFGEAISNLFNKSFNKL